MKIQVEYETEKDLMTAIRRGLLGVAKRRHGIETPLMLMGIKESPTLLQQHTRKTKPLVLRRFGLNQNFCLNLLR